MLIPTIYIDLKNDFNSHYKKSIFDKHFEGQQLSDPITNAKTNYTFLKYNLRTANFYTVVNFLFRLLRVSPKRAAALYLLFHLLIHFNLQVGCKRCGYCALVYEVQLFWPFLGFYNCLLDQISKTAN